MRLFAGLDVSTQGCKIVIIDSGKKAVVYIDSINYDKDLQHYSTCSGVVQGLGEGASESNPLMWIEAVESIFRNLQESEIQQNTINCISISGQQHGLVALDSAGNLSRQRSKLWNDFSTAKECALLYDAVGGREAMIKEVGNSQRTGYTAAKIYHMLRHEPDNYKKTSTFFLVHNYINWFLTGGIICLEPGDTSGMALWNPKTGKWSEKIISAIDPRLQQKLPKIKPSNQSIGFLAKSLVKKFGFSSECKIDAGSGDNMYGAIGTGNIKPGIVTVSLGTSGTAYTFMKEPYIDPTGELAAFCDSTGNYLSLLCVSNLANGYNQFLTQHSLSHDRFSRLIKQTRAGNSGRILIPWFSGERTPDVPEASPVYFGFGLEDFTPDILGRAVLEGHILNLYEGFQRMPVKPIEIRLTGGLARSEVWRQAIADIFEAEVVPVEGEGAALGAAIHAAWVWFMESDRKVSLEHLVSQFVCPEEALRKKPCRENLKTCRLQKRLFHSLTQRLLNKEGENPFTLQNKIKSNHEL